MPYNHSLSQGKSREDSEHKSQGPCCQILQSNRYRIFFCGFLLCHANYDKNQLVLVVTIVGGACVFTILPQCACKNNAMAGKNSMLQLHQSYTNIRVYCNTIGI